jgi:hypothetical protein
MNPRTLTFASLALGTASALGTLTLAYGLVYPSAAAGTKLPLAGVIVLGAIVAQAAALFSLRTLRLAKSESERFFALLTLLSAVFFSFVIVFGFGIPALVLGVHD